MRNEIQALEKGVEVKDIIRDPYVLEFLGLHQTPNLYEKDIEQGLIDHLQKFLLELGRGFSFVARQKRITFDGERYFIDLVFYNYILKCFVIIVTAFIGGKKLSNHQVEELKKLIDEHKEV